MSLVDEVRKVYKKKFNDQTEKFKQRVLDIEKKNKLVIEKLTQEFSQKINENKIDFKKREEELKSFVKKFEGEVVKDKDVTVQSLQEQHAMDNITAYKTFEDRLNKELIKINGDYKNGTKKLVQEYEQKILDLTETQRKNLNDTEETYKQKVVELEQKIYNLRNQYYNAMAIIQNFSKETNDMLQLKIKDTKKKLSTFTSPTLQFGETKHIKFQKILKKPKEKGIIKENIVKPKIE